MALTDNLTTEKQKLSNLLESEYPLQNFRDTPLVRLLIIKFLLGEFTGTSGSNNSTKAVSAPTTSVASSVTSVPLLVANTNRKWASFRNDSTSVAYVAKNSTASSSSVYLLEPQGYQYLDDYTGIISAIWLSANGFMRIEEGV